MKKLLVLALFTFCIGVYADNNEDEYVPSGFDLYRANSGYDFYIGASTWYTNANGGIQVPAFNNYTIELAEEDINKRFNAIYFTAFEHPVRWLPDIRLAQNNIRQDGRGDLTILSTVFPIDGALNLNHTDITLYYNVHSGIGFIDLGLTARLLNGELALAIPSSKSSSELKTRIGLLYIKTGVDLPLPGLSLGGTINAGDNGKERSADMTLYMQYETRQGLGVNGGYRYFQTDIESRGAIGGVPFDLQADFNVYGAFISMYYHL